MSKLHDLINLMELEEKARTCVNRATAQRVIRQAEEARRNLWGNSASATPFESS